MPYSPATAFLALPQAIRKLMTVKLIASNSKAIITPLMPVALLGFTAVAGATSAQAAVSDVEQVTIYQGLASVTRTLPVTAAGEQTLVFSCLSPSIDEGSISVQAPPSVNVGEVSIERLTGEQAAQCQYQTDTKVQSQQQTLAEINADLEAARLAKAYLQNLTKVTQISVDGTVGGNARDLETQASTINKRILVLQQQQARAQDALNQLMAGSTGATRNSVTQVSVRTATRTPGSVKLHYQVRGASWQPTYQARLNTETEQLSIIASAVIAQQTGENWTNIPLTLSSVDPNQNTTGSLPVVPRLSLYEEEQDNTTKRLSARPMAAPIVAMAQAEYSADMAEGGGMAPLPSFTVNSQDKNGITEYRLPQRVSIPSDGRRVQTVIAEQAGKSKVWLRSTPQRELQAYWYASAPFLTPAWVDGSLQLYRDDNYVGQSNYSYQQLKEQGIGFGEDPNLLVKQLLNESKQGDKGVLNRMQTVTSTQSYQFTNQHKRTVRLQVLGSEPVSQDEAIKLLVTHTPPVTEKNWNDNKGMVAWQFDLPAQQTQVVSSTQQISYPASKQLSGN